MRDAWWDLVLGGRCVGCRRPGRALCPGCAVTLPAGGRPSWPTPVPAGLVAPWSAGDYDGVVRQMVLAHKERGVLALRRPLGRLLALAAGAAAAAAPAPDGLLLVPVPSRPGVARARGHDPTWAITSYAARLLRRDGPVLASRLLVSRRGVLDQAGLDARSRAANLAGSMACPTASAAPAGRATPDGRGVRRRAHHRVHRPRGATRSGGLGGAGRSDRRGGGDATTCLVAHMRGGFGPMAFAATRHRLASLHGVRSGPWLRHRDALDPQGVPMASRCQSQAKRST